MYLCLSIQKYSFMKKLIPVISLLFYVAVISAQNLSLSNANGPLNPGDTITVWVANDEAHEEHVYVTNSSSATINVKVKKETIVLLTGAFSTFCWGQCFSPSVIESPSPLPIGAGETNSNSFYADYNAWGADGLTAVRFTFFDESAPSDSADVIIKFYTTPASVQDNSALKADISLPFPNPAVNKCHFTYNIPSAASNAMLVIMDLTGNIVHREQLSGSGKTTVDVSALSSGIYFYSLRINDNAVVTRKLVVQK